MALLNYIRASRNTYIAHQEIYITEAELARVDLRRWISGLTEFYTVHHG